MNRSMWAALLALASTWGCAEPPASPEVASPEVASHEVASPDVASPDVASPDVASHEVASQVCVVRHAQAYKNLEPPPAGLDAAQLDALTPEGEAQARALAPKLPPGVARVWASPAGRTQQTAALLGLGPAVEVREELRPLDGAVAWEERAAAWARGEDPRPEGGESLADGAARTDALLAEVGSALPPGGHAVLVTHGDIASLLLGALRGTSLLERPTVDTLATGQAACLPLPASPAGGGR